MLVVFPFPLFFANIFYTKEKSTLKQIFQLFAMLKKQNDLMFLHVFNISSLQNNTEMRRNPSFFSSIIPTAVNIILNIWRMHFLSSVSSSHFPLGTFLSFSLQSVAGCVQVSHCVSRHTASLAERSVRHKNHRETCGLMSPSSGALSY